MINVAVLGYGTVGSGVVEVLESNREVISRRAGDTLNIKYILDLRDFPGDPYENKVIHDYQTILEDASVAVICETMGGLKPAYQFTKSALEAGKSVCTSNKELVAKYGPELLKVAKAHNCNYMFEASVGGGIPIIRSINSALTAEKIEEISGILNGTTNYILSKMEREGADFETVLKEAQEKGYAERHPEADIEGYDACRKIAILSSLMTSRTVNYEKIYTEGITGITADDFVYARACGRSIKLLAMSKATAEGTVALVAPCLIDSSHPLYMVNDVFNGILVKGNMLGDFMYYGRGAGKLPTASAVAADVIDCAKHLGVNVGTFWEEEEETLVDIGISARAFFVRAKAEAADALQKAFPEGTPVKVDGRADIGFETPVMPERQFEEKYAALGDLVYSRIRIEA